MADVPTSKLELSETGPFDTPSWLDITTSAAGRKRLVAWNSHIGGAGELDDIPAGTGAVTLDNYDGVFDPDNTTSPLFAYLTINRRLRITETWDATAYIVFDQFVDFWPMDDDPTWPARQTVVTTTDALGMLANRTIKPARPFTLDDPDLGLLDSGNLLGGHPHFAATISGLRIAEILNLIGYPPALTDIDTGQTSIVADAPTDKVLPVLQQINRSEMGTLYAKADGTLTFRERRAWTHIPEQNTSQATFADNGAGLGYEDVQVDRSKALIKNRVARQRVGSDRVYSAQDQTSIDAFGLFEDSKTDLLNSNTLDLLGQCQYVLSRYKDGVARVTGLTISGIEDADTVFPLLLAVDLGWRFTVGRTPKLGGSMTERVVVVTSIAHERSAPNRYRTTLGFFEADTHRYFTLDDPVYGLLDSGNTLAY